MALEPRQEITDLTRAPGELSFEARVGGASRRIWFRTETDLSPNADAALVACLMPAMRGGGSLEMTDPVSPKLLRNQREFQGIQRAWSRGWRFGEPLLEEVEVRAPLREPEPATSGQGRVAAFFSGGVDSFWTVLENPDVTDLIFVRGFDLMPGSEHQAELTDEVEGRMREVATSLGLPLHVVETNLRELSDPLNTWITYFGSATAAVALFMAPRFERVLIAGDSDYEAQEKFGANWLVDQLLGTEELEICEAGGRRNRIERTQRIAFEPVVQRALRVCWENRDGAYNCGRCRKCMLTMAPLEAIGALDRVETFAAELDLDALAEIEIDQPVTLALWEDVLDCARRSGRRDLERAVENAVDRGKRNLGLPAGFRRRRRRGPPPLLAAAEVGGAPRYLASPATAAALAEARAVAILIGGYDGSGNFGDLVQLDVAGELLAAQEEELLVLPTVERGYAESHRELVDGLVHPFPHALFFDAGEGGDDGLVPVAPPEDLSYACVYLYGGGYLNPAWGERKLAMLRAAELLLPAEDAELRRVASGLQVDSAWVATRTESDRRMLATFTLLGARDERSRRGLAQLGSGAEAFDSGDDAVGALRRLPVGPPTPQGRPRVNVQFAEHPWVSDEPDPVFSTHLAFLREIARRAESLIVQPLVAFADPRVDEQPALARLLAACTELGIEVADPVVLRSTEIEPAAEKIGAATLTLSCSYHVALTSLMLGVPAFLQQGNSYYRQKADGLRDAFGPEPIFTSVPGEEAEQAAKRVVGPLFDPATAAEPRRQLAGRAAAIGERRAETEAKLLAELGLEGPRQFIPRAEIADLSASPGELSFEARVGGTSRRIWFRTESEVTPNADAALAACLVPAMRSGGILRMQDPVSPRLLQSQPEYQAIQRAWSREWDFGEPVLREVEVQAPLREPEPSPSGQGRVAAFFSGGVDSYSTVLENPEVTDLIFVRGLDLLPRIADHRALVDEVEQRLRGAAAELGLQLHVVETNIRELSDPIVSWEAYNPSALAAVALFLAPLFERVLIASDTDHATQVPLGSGHMIDQLWSTESLEIADDGGLLGREERMRQIVENPAVRGSLRVCWQNHDGAYNCGRCRKCVLTMIGLEAIGARESVSSFPPQLDLGLLADYEITQPIQLILWEDLLDTTRANGRHDLEQAVEGVVESGKRALHLPPSYRVREDGPPAAKPADASAAEFDLEALKAALHEAEGRVEEAEARAAEAEGRDAEARDLLAIVLGSSSWRLTAPVRRLSGLARRWRRGI
ncbi:MAG TPA: hypothetical protein VMS60_09695 [Solirubrobacterales bacterium]|nr:hypothetical protein [Solirubrobacterales bacterium]